ncbi:hypothetical protein [Natronomonas sp. EA1]|uniref:hypothetical protein n=1 Tax=Natronomonas sp. EA1 TaxID=3421655 RepID=UPI003EBE68F7
MSYVVEVKRSARRVSPRAGAWVRDEGAVHDFDSKALARKWARRLSPPGRSVWVQDAPPHAQGAVDGYVVGGRRTPPRRDPDPGEQASLAEL